MVEEMAIETLYEQPVVQELLKKLDTSSDLEKDVKLPYVLPGKILMSPGVWNGYYYSREAIGSAFLKSGWDKKEVRSLFNDHQDSRSREWIGEVRNPRMAGDDVVGDLYIVDKSTAIKLAYGAKMGISPKVSGHEEGGAMTSFIFDNFSVVINPAVKTAYINNAEKAATVEPAKLQVNAEVIKMADEPKVEPQPVENSQKAEELKCKPKEMPEDMSAADKELSEYTAFIKEYIKKNPDASIKDAAKAWEKKKMSETIDLSDVMGILNQLKLEIEELKKKYPYPYPEVKAPEEKKPEPAMMEQKPAEPVKVENKTEESKPVEQKVENSENKVIEELSEKVEKMEKQLNEPAKVTVKTEELAEKGDMDSQILRHLRSIGPMEV